MKPYRLLIVVLLLVLAFPAQAASEFTFHLFDQNGTEMHRDDLAATEQWRLDLTIQQAESELQPGECRDYFFYPAPGAAEEWRLNACRAAVDSVGDGGASSGTNDDTQQSIYRIPQVATLFKLTGFSTDDAVVAKTDHAYATVEVKPDGVASLVVPYGTTDWEGTIEVLSDGKTVARFTMTGPATQDDQAQWVSGTATRQCANPYATTAPLCPAKPAG